MQHTDSDRTGVCRQPSSFPNSSKTAPCSPLPTASGMCVGIALVPADQNNTLGRFIYRIFWFSTPIQDSSFCTFCVCGFHIFLIRPHRTLCSSCIDSARLVLDYRYLGALACYPNTHLHLQSEVSLHSQMDGKHSSGISQHSAYK